MLWPWSIKVFGSRKWRWTLSLPCIPSWAFFLVQRFPTTGQWPGAKSWSVGFGVLAQASGGSTGLSLGLSAQLFRCALPPATSLCLTWPSPLAPHFHPALLLVHGEKKRLGSPVLVYSHPLVTLCSTPVGCGRSGWVTASRSCMCFLIRPVLRNDSPFHFHGPQLRFKCQDSLCYQTVGPTWPSERQEYRLLMVRTSATKLNT